jgi:hypothetical protein
MILNVLETSFDRSLIGPSGQDLKAECLVQAPHRGKKRSLEDVS